MRIFRAVADITPLQNTPHYHGDGVLGEGTYFSHSLGDWPLGSITSDDDQADNGRNFLVINEFEINTSNSLALNDQNTEGLESMMTLSFTDALKNVGKKIEAYKLSSKLKKLGIEFLIVTGKDVDGGQQVFIPKGMTPKVIKKSFTLHFRSQILAKEFAKTFNQKITRSKFGHFRVMNVPASIDAKASLWLSKKFSL